MKINIEPVKGFIKDSFVVVGPIIGAVLYSKLTESIPTRYSYSDAIEAIMSSSMYSDDKKKAVKLVKRAEVPEYYKAIVSIIDSSMWSQDKLSSIENLSETGGA